MGVGRKYLVAVRCPCCDAVDVDTRHACIYPRARELVNQHQLLLQAISHALKQLGRWGSFYALSVKVVINLDGVGSSCDVYFLMFFSLFL